MYLNGMGFRGIERVTGVHHTTIINWVKQVGELLPNAYDPEVIPEVGELDELETFVGSKKTKYGAAAIAASDAGTEPIGSKLLCNAGRTLTEPIGSKFCYARRWRECAVPSLAFGKTMAHPCRNAPFFELCSCDSSRPLQTVYFRLGFRRSQLENI